VSFSLKYLFALVALAAFFTAAIIHRTPFWTVTAVNLTAVVLLVGTIGVWFQRLNRTFWIPFCLVGWFYFVFALTPQGRNRLHAFLPGTQIAHMINLFELAQRGKMDQTALREWEGGIVNLFDVLNSCWVLLAGMLAGIISLLLIRKPKTGAKQLD
jgi:hypothetical protein